MTTEDFNKIYNTIPKDPGVYRFINEDDTILYVGKAKNLKNRLSSYFGERKDRLFRTQLMVKNAERIEFTIVETETDALLLESSLIKEYQPRYNVMLKDDRTYSYICIKKEPFPRVFFTRRVIRDGSIYFGPYTSKVRTQIIWELLRQLFPLRTCQLNLAPENIAAGKFKVCLEYHIKNCQGPCEGFEDLASYNAKIEQIKNILKGNFGAVIQHFRGLMNAHAEKMEFEKAQAIKEKLTAFEDYQAKSTVVSSSIRDVDVFSIASDEKEAYINYLRVVNGVIIHTHTQELVVNLEEEEADLLAYTIPLIRDRFNSIAPELILPFEVQMTDKNLTTTVPKIGEKRKLLELSLKNVQYYRAQKKRDDASKTKRQSPAERILRTLQADLQMSEVPMHIECFDNSNIQGSNPVSSCVVFKNAKPSKQDYRHFKVKTVIGPNDFDTMKEVVFRRYRRLLDENQPLPQLVIIDGGKGQLSAAMESIVELGLTGKMTIIGIAKRLEEIFFPGDSVPLYINKKSESLKLIQQARNEAHRFAITFHRDQRSKNFIDTELNNIPGIGEKTAQKLLTHFGSVRKIREALASELIEVLGMAKAKVVKAYFDKEVE
ncbi:MAG TPA: excinuclease ABC subunit UvrC [Haliscomenobacter sp.]|uniref:excinuclease ABC subunit UvrC n=1 Tax=Haliscomenobacter sp. TaxID=2717303 RepID=UPI002C087A06|nr:excinuclease ABC subunit UvrC [Haliscomenobacter sp.]HOY16319.1 excinuclease ABC subunit UvrC [Haliscomenobacter sp.]